MKLPLRTMAGRVFLILMAGIVVSTLLSLGLANRDRQRVLGQLRSAHNAERVAQLVLTLDALPPSDRLHAQAGASSAGLVVNFDKAQSQPPDAQADLPLTEALIQRLGSGHQITVWRWACLAPERGVPPLERPARSGTCRSVSMSLSDGTPLSLLLRAPPPPPGLAEAPGSLLWLSFFAACIGILAYAVARITTRPLRQLADAATILGHQMDSPPMPLEGPEEVRHAAAAFNAMQERIRHYVQERLRMLAAITHDLQTPLTRLRLRLEKVGDEDLRVRLIEDLAAMQAMVKEGLDLVRTLDAPLPLAPLDLHSLLDSLCLDAADAGQDVQLEGEGEDAPIRVLAHPESLRRCLGNLMDNALKYGSQARVFLGREEGRAVVYVRDSGLGIPEDQLEAVFEPFARLETSRSRDTGGTGLGLTIAREVAQRHGGRLTLANRPGGGLEARLELPVQG
ncbi:MAG: ATP-binding protein [Rhodocyclaceae bacterium]|nr:ATP-binding protein [Rhodocyclaceae bacterium]